MYSSSRARYMYRYSKAIYSSSIDSPALYCSYRALCSSFRALYSYSITHLEPSQITSLVPTTAPLELSTAPLRALEFLSSSVQLFWRPLQVFQSPLQLFQSPLTSTYTAHLDSRALYCIAPLEPFAFTAPLLLLQYPFTAPPRAIHRYSRSLYYTS